MGKVGQTVLQALDTYVQGNAQSITKQELDVYVRNVLYSEHSDFLNRLPEEVRDAQVDGIVDLTWEWFGF
jgi:hypothetical protein